MTAVPNTVKGAATSAQKPKALDTPPKAGRSFVSKRLKNHHRLATKTGHKVSLRAFVSSVAKDQSSHLNVEARTFLKAKKES